MLKQVSQLGLSPIGSRTKKAGQQFYCCICQEKVDTNKNETQNPDSVLN